MSWNYRVVKRDRINLTGGVETSFAIHEAYYDDDGKVYAISMDPMDAHGDSINELRDDLGVMLVALNKPVLNYDDF